MTKKLFFLAIATLFLAITTSAQVVEDSVLMGPGYVNDIYYSLYSGDKTTVGGADWTVGFYNEAVSAAIMINTGRGVKLYKVNDDTTTFTTPLDTTNYASTWTALYDDWTQWSANSAFEAEPTGGQLNYGWGEYNMSSHVIAGSRVFFMNINDTYYYKVMIVKKQTGTFTFRYATIDNSLDTTIIVTPADYLDKNYVYLNMTNHTIVDLEPNNTEWDLQFTRYRDFLPEYGIDGTTTGVLVNEGVEVATVTDVPSTETTSDISALTFSADKNSLGHYWKGLNSSYQWYTFDSTSYYVKTIDQKLYKIYFTKFGGTSSGRIVFNKEEIAQDTTNINDINSIVSYTVYPNPTKGQIELVLDLNANQNLQIVVSDMFGRTVYQSSSINANLGLNAYRLDLSANTNGVYLVQLSNGKSTSTRKVILNK